MTPETSIYEYAKQGMAISPQKTALWFYGKSVTYRELFTYIDNFAGHLHGIGVSRGSVVTVYLPNCPQAVIAIYAIAKLGGVCNIIHPLMPLDGVRQNMEFAESSILLVGAQSSQVEEIDFAEKIIFVDLGRFMDLPHRLVFRMKQRMKRPEWAFDFDQMLLPYKKDVYIPVQEELKDSCVCYFHSSGTTGEPKTVMHSHLTCNNWVHDAKAFFKDSSLENEVVLSVLPIFHASGLIMNIHQVLCAGGTQVLMAKWSPKEAVRVIRKHKISVLTGVPFMYQSILEQPAFKGRTASGITQCYVSGDAMPLEYKVAFNERVGRPVVYEGYGMTEIITACFAISAHNYNINASGYPLINCTAALLTEMGDIVYRGTGEMILNTNTMMLGYLKDPKATAECFIEKEGKQWFRTGDLGMIDDEGYLYFLERMKNIIIRNGYNIYPTEIETLIRKFPFVNDVSVIGKKSAGARGEDICAVVVLSDNKNVQHAKNEIMNACYEKLPKYSIPNVVVAIDEIPRNRMNKVDKAKLVEML